MAAGGKFPVSVRVELMVWGSMVACHPFDGNECILQQKMHESS